MSLPIFSPNVLPDIGTEDTPILLGDSISERKPYTGHLPRGVHSFRSIPLRWSDIEEDDKDYIISFFTSELEGSFGAFLWIPFDKQESPLGVLPRLTQVAGGSISQTTYFVKFTWFHDTYGETKPSAESSLTVDANKFLRVSVPPIPLWLQKWRVYIGTSAGVNKLEDTVNLSRSWTQSVPIVGTQDPPVSNTLNQIRKWSFIPGSIRKSRTGDLFWNVAVDVVEQMV